MTSDIRDGLNLPVFAVEEPTLCPACGSETSLHQPDIRLPDRLLATCEVCGAWSLVIVLPEGERAMALLLPAATAILERS